jgi:hypothetical protein
VRIFSVMVVTAALLAGPVFLPPAHASSNLRLCNSDSERRYQVAAINREVVFLGFRWRATGWYNISPGDCIEFNTTNRVAEIFLSILREQDDGTFEIEYYGWDPAPTWPSPGGNSYAEETFFCVSDDPFERAADNIDDLRQCWPFHYLQLFNLYVVIQSPTNYTINLGG